MNKFHYPSKKEAQQKLSVFFLVGRVGISTFRYAQERYNFHFVQILRPARFTRYSFTTLHANKNWPREVTNFCLVGRVGIEPTSPVFQTGAVTNLATAPYVFLYFLSNLTPSFSTIKMTNLERETGVEPATFSMARRRSSH